MRKLKDIIYIKESVIDLPKKELSSTVWSKENNSYILKEDVKREIIRRLVKFLSDFKVDNDSVKKLYVVGSITGFKYNEKSDIDVSVGLDVPQDVMKTLIANVLSYNEKPLQGTEHPINFYIIDSKTELKTGDFTYNIITDKWEKQPAEIMEDIDYVSIMTLALSECHAIDNDEDELRRDLIDYVLLKHDLKEVYELKIPENEIKDMIKKKELEIFADLDNLKKRYIQIHNFRMMAFSDTKDQYLTKVKTNIKDNNYTINNIVWKILERYGYIKRLKEYLKVHSYLMNSETIDLKTIGELKKIFNMDF